MVLLSCFALLSRHQTGQYRCFFIWYIAGLSVYNETKPPEGAFVTIKDLQVELALCCRKCCSDGGSCNLSVHLKLLFLLTATCGLALVPEPL